MDNLPAPTGLFGIGSVTTYYGNLNLQTDQFHLKLTSHEIVLKLLEDINAARSMDIDKIGGRFLKDGATVLAAPINNFFNLSISLSSFPEKCKIAILKPLYKKGSKLEVKNYRPISLLPIISKIFEKIIHNQTRAYLEIH